MTPIDLLFSYPRIKHELQETVAELRSLYECQELAYNNLQSPIGRFGEAPLTKGRVGDPTAQQAILMCDYYDDKIDRLLIKRKELQELIEKAYNVVDHLSDREKQIVTLRFFERRHWHDVCALMKISRRTAHYERNKILDKLSNKRT